LSGKPQRMRCGAVHATVNNLIRIIPSLLRADKVAVQIFPYDICSPTGGRMPAPMQDVLSDDRVGDLPPDRLPSSAAVIDIELMDGMSIQGRLLGGFHPERGLQLQLNDGGDFAVPPIALRCAVLRSPGAQSSLASVGPNFRLQLVDGATWEGRLDSMQAFPLGLIIRGAQDGLERQIYVAHPAIRGLSVTGADSSTVHAVAAEPAGAGEKTDPQSQARLFRPGEVMVLQSVADLKVYLEMLEGQRPHDTGFSSVALESLRASDTVDLTLYELGAQCCGPGADRRSGISDAASSSSGIGFAAGDTSGIRSNL
jgi:hypothetical protein